MNETNNKWSWRIGVIVGIALALAAVPMLYASGLLERDQRQLDRARENYAQEIERALDIYNTRVERANQTLDRVYGQLITRYERRGENDIADQLRAELSELKRMTIDPQGNHDDTHGASNDDDGDEKGDASPGDAHDELIQAVGPVLVDANGRAMDSQALREANYVVLFFTAQWCRPCRQFTPHLVEFHRQYSRAARIAVVYVSSDRSEEQMMQYLQSRDMPFLAVPYQRVEGSGLKSRFNRRGGIPNVVVLDRRGEVVLRSTYPDMPPLRVLHELADRL